MTERILGEVTGETGYDGMANAGPRRGIAKAKAAVVYKGRPASINAARCAR
jgi:hypothetical protein